MSDETSDLDGMLGFLAEEGRQRNDPEEHPDPETLTAYQANELSPEEDERIQDHLAVCGHCTELLLDLEEFLQPEVVTEEAASDFEAAADWRRLRAAAEEAQKPGRPVHRDGGDKRTLRSLRIFQALAAGLGTLAIGLFLYNVHIQGRARVLPEQPLSFGTTRSAPEFQKVTVRVPVVLRIVPTAEYPRYRVEIETASSERKSLEFTAGIDGGLIELPSGWEPGNYKIRLLGLKGGEPEPIGRPQELTVIR